MDTEVPKIKHPYPLSRGPKNLFKFFQSQNLRLDKALAFSLSTVIHFDNFVSKSLWGAELSVIQNGLFCWPLFRAVHKSNLPCGRFRVNTDFKNNLEITANAEKQTSVKTDMKY